MLKSIVKIDKDLSIVRLKCELPEKTTGIGYSQSENAVIFYSSLDGTVGFAYDGGETKTVTRRTEINAPIGMCCDEWGTCVFQFTRDMLWNFDQSYRTGMRLCGAGVFNSLSNVTPSDVKDFAPCGICRTGRSSIVIAAPWTNKLFSVENGQLGKSIGSGKRGFLSANLPEVSMFSSPSGVCFDKGSGMIFISDTGNSIVRVFKDKHEKPCLGMPSVKGSTDGVGTSARFSYPSIIRSNNGQVSLVDGNLIRTFKISSLDVATSYASPNQIVDLALGGGAKYILEQIK